MAVSRAEEIRIAASPRSSARAAATVLLCLRVLLIPGEAARACARPGMVSPGVRARRPKAVPDRHTADLESAA
jgi:hypothetical protein